MLHHNCNVRDKNTVRWLLTLMASATVKYGAIIAVCSLLVLLLYLSEYRAVLNTSGNELFFTQSTYSNNDGMKYFHVQKYRLQNEDLELVGYENENDRLINKPLQLIIKGLSHLINQAKPFIQSDEKLDNITLTKKHYFKDTRRTSNVSCRALIRGDKEELAKAEKLMKEFPKRARTNEHYIKLTENCTRFIEEQGYITDHLTEVEREFPIAFSLLMYKDVEQSERLLRAIYRPQNIYCIHVDSNSGEEIFKAMARIADCFENVFIASERFKVQWGTMTVLEPELLCMKELWNKSKKWKYFINLTGQEFPLRTNYELVQILKTYNGANDLESTVEHANKDRWEGIGSAPHGIVPTKGSVHIVASRAYVDFVLHDHRAQDFLNWTRKAKIPDETFFSSLNHNPHLGVPGSYKGLPETTHQTSNIKPFVARFKNWGDGKYDWPCTGQRVRMICVFGTGDLPLLASRREMFANKFYLEYQHFALDCMEELHYNHTRDQYLGKLTFDPRWYSKLGFVTNKVD